jgi:CIC family chloride channel protein
MRGTREVLSAELTVQDSMEKVRTTEFHAWPVCEEHGIIGVISRASLKAAETKGLSNKRLRDLVDTGDFPHVHEDHSLHLALDRMGTNQLDLLPVVSRANVHQLEGIVTLQDILALYGVNSKEVQPPPKIEN